MNRGGKHDEKRVWDESSFMNIPDGVHENAKSDTLSQRIVPDEQLQCREQEKEGPWQGKLEFQECSDEEQNFNASRQQEYCTIVEPYMVEKLTHVSETIFHVRE
jgi:hypothetical protein